MKWTDVLQRTTLGSVTVAEKLGIPMEGHGMIRCPLHDDRTPSLSWRWAEGKLLLYCHSHQCSYKDIRAAL